MTFFVNSGETPQCNELKWLSTFDNGILEIGFANHATKAFGGKQLG